MKIRIPASVKPSAAVFLNAVKTTTTTRKMKSDHAKSYGAAAGMLIVSFVAGTAYPPVLVSMTPLFPMLATYFAAPGRPGVEPAFVSVVAPVVVAFTGAAGDPKAAAHTPGRRSARPSQINTIVPTSKSPAKSC
jgi:hypothetical protein